MEVKGAILYMLIRDVTFKIMEILGQVISRKNSKYKNLEEEGYWHA